MELFDSVKKNWNIFLQFAAWIMSIATSFLINPPVINYSDISKVKPTTSFFIASLSALLIIPLKIKSKKEDYKYWQKISIVSIILATLLISTYNLLIESWTIQYFEENIIIGSEMNEIAFEEYKEIYKNDSNIKEFVMGRPDNNESIWNINELKQRKLILTIIYTFTVVSITTFIISAIQSISLVRK